ncbi:MAG: hypothetical protein HY763_07075 [Planctomycetes bacterium]|nr:hypothetical protein [Planctomycetota bacterium]
MSLEVQSASTSPSAWIPVARGRAAARAVFWGIPAFLAALGANLTLERVNLSPSGISSRLVDVSLGAVGLLLVVAAIGCVIPAVRWLGLTVWPGRVGVWADPRELCLRLGPFGTRRYPAAELVVRYPYELDDGEEGFEAFLPEEEQQRLLLPHIRHRGETEALHELILRLAPGNEERIAAALRPVIERWRLTCEPRDPTR